MDYLNVVIGIQARSTSARFPRKVFSMIGDKPMLKHVVDACFYSANYLNKYSRTIMATANVALLVPEGDEIASNHIFRRYQVIEGSEKDVLSRYIKAANILHADYMVRITGDCPLIPPFLISKAIKLALINKYDYLSNVDPEARTAIDGMDCEVISKKGLAWLDANAKTSYDREHVTPLIIREPASDLNRGHMLNYLNMSDIKLSVDTEDDLTHVRLQYEKVRKAAEGADRIFGRGKVHWF